MGADLYFKNILLSVMWNGREARAEVGRLALQVRPGKKVLAQRDGGGRGEQEK